jgi:hypothetical protein
MDDKYIGMTVNERLYVSGLIDKFDNAVKRKDVSTIVSILEKIELKEESIKPILDSLKLGNVTD